MSYALKTKLAAHFRSNRNEWQTVNQLRAGLDLSAHGVHNVLARHIKNGLMQRDEEVPRRYRIKPDELYRRAHRDDLGETTARFAAKVRAFCRAWNVSAPHEITSKNPDAMREWSALTE